MVLKIKTADGGWQFIENVVDPTVKRDDAKHAVDVRVKDTVHHIVGEAYLLNDHGQTVERLN